MMNDTKNMMEMPYNTEKEGRQRVIMTQIYSQKHALVLPKRQEKGLNP